MRNSAVLIALLVFLSANLTWAMGKRKPFDPPVSTVVEEPYDISKEVSFEGDVIRIDPPSNQTLPFFSYHMHLQQVKDVVEVHLGPYAVVAHHVPTLKVGDHVRGIGAVSSWRSGSRRVIVAREVHRGDDTLILRDAQGNPLLTAH